MLPLANTHVNESVGELRVCVAGIVLAVLIGIVLGVFIGAVLLLTVHCLRRK